MICEVYSIKASDICTDDETSSCETESLRRNIVKAQIEIVDGISKDISGEISIDDGAPEVSEIVCYDTGVCIDTTEVSDGIVKIRGKVSIECLYESREGDLTEYVSMEKDVPFEAEADVPCIENGWKVCVNAVVDTSSLNAVSDNYGEQRILEFSVSLIMKLTAAKNNDCVVITDMYSTNKLLIPYRETKRIYSLVDAYSTETEYKDRVRIDLRGITDIISCKLDVYFGPPDFADGTCFIPAKGTLVVLGVKENGEIDSQSAVLNMRMPIQNIPSELFASKLKWIGDTYLCDSECMISGGELEMLIRTDGKVLALLEDNVEVVTGFDLSDLSCDSSKKSGFSIFYPQKNENVWNVAKAHGVSYDRVKKENSIVNQVFDSDTPVILR